MPRPPARPGTQPDLGQRIGRTVPRQSCRGMVPPIPAAFVRASLVGVAAQPGRRDGSSVDHPVPVARNGAAASPRPIHAIAAIDWRAGQHAARRRSRGHAVPHLFAEMPQSRIAPAHADRRSRQNLDDPDPRCRRRRRVTRPVVACAAPPVPAGRTRPAIARVGNSRWIQQAQQRTLEHIVVCKRWLCHVYRSPRIERTCVACTTGRTYRRRHEPRSFAPPCATRFIHVEAESSGTNFRHPSACGRCAPIPRCAPLHRPRIRPAGRSDSRHATLDHLPYS